MNRFLTYIAAGTAALTVMLTGCSDDDRVPVDDINGTYTAQQTTLTVNGNKVADATMQVRLKEELPSYKDNRAEAVMVFDRQILVVDNEDDYYENNLRGQYAFMPLSMVIEADARGRDNTVSFEGTRTVNAPGKGEISYAAKGSYRPGSKNSPATVAAGLTVSANIKELTGHTFEMELNLNDITYDLTKWSEGNVTGLDIGYPEALKELYGTMVDRMRRATGFDRIRFRFNADGTMTVAGRNAITGNYAEQPSAEYQLLSNGTLVILQDCSWADMMLSAMAPYDISVRAPRGLYIFTALDKAITAATFTLKEGRLIMQPVVSEMINGGRYRKPAEKAFFDSWGVSYDPTGSGYTRGELLYYAVRTAVLDDEMFVAPYFMATHVD